MQGLLLLIAMAVLLAVVLAPATGLSLVNNSNSLSNFNESLNYTTNPDPETPYPSPSVEDTANGMDTEANQTETMDESVDVVYDSTPKPVIIMFKDKSDTNLIKQHGGKIKSAYQLKPALAVNTHKSIYLPDETSFISMAVLDNEGHMVCDAEVTLTITDPDNKETVLSTGNGLIKVSPQCSVYGVTDLPDYYTNYTVGGVGTYTMNLTAITPDGTKSITDTFNVQSSVDFDVVRDGPTRIYPLVPYVMNFTIEANKDYNGLINEYVPASFEITSQEGLTVTTVGDTKILTWNKNLVKGETCNIYYEFDAPDISPYLFLLGRLQIGSFEEKRDWMIASDADTTLRPNGDGTTNSFTSTAATFYTEIDDDPDAADDDTTYVQGPNKADGSMFVLLGDTPADFTSADTVEIKAKHKEVGNGNDVTDIYYQIFESDETTAITAETLATTLTQGTYNIDAKSVSITGTNDKTTWDDAKLRIWQDYAKSGQADTTSQARITAVEVTITYTPSDTTPPASITNLHNTTYASTYINWSWTNPTDSDFNHTMVYINGNWKENVSSPLNYSNATGLSPNTNNTISTHTVDTSGNVNLTWVNHSAWTAPSEDTTPPASITNLHNTTYASTYINWSWLNPADADFNHTMVYINGNWKENVSSLLNYYNATGLSPNTNNTISTHTVDTSGNVNQTWVNHSAWTAPSEDTTAPLITDENLNRTEINTGETVRLNATTSDPDSDVTEVKFKIKYPDGTSANFSATEITTNYWEYNFSDTSQIGEYNWTDTYATSSGGTNHTTPAKTFNVHDITQIPTTKLYESSTSDFPGATAVIDLLSSRDGTANNVDFELVTGNLYTFVNATSNATGSDITIPSGSTINFSAYFSCGNRVDYAYLTWKFYKLCGSTETLICKKGNDSTGGVQLPDDGTATLTGSCTATSDVTLSSTDKLKLVLNVYAHDIGSGGAAATKKATHCWDSTSYESWVQYEYIAPPRTNATSVNATTVGVNDIICVNHTVTKGTYDIDKTWVEITYPNGTSANITTSNTTGVCGAGGNVYGVEINVGSTLGNLTVNTSWVNDTQGNIDYDDPYPNILVSVKDLKAPQWSDPNTNKTTIYEGDYVKFTANWSDDVALAGYKFSTNQSGPWVNSSFTSFSGTSNISENITQITASAGTTVGWRFYANDTSDNGNATDIQTFVVESAEVITPGTPFMIYGRVFYEDGSECNNSLVVNITNLNNSKQWGAKTNASYNYYQLMLANGTDLNASEILQFNTSDGIRYNTTNYTVTQENITDGGLFEFNLTLPSPPKPSTPFMIYGWVFYEDGSKCNGSTVNVTNTNTSRHWQAETNASYNFYQLVLATTNVSEGNVLSFNTSDGIRYNTTNHTITQENVTDGGLFEFNLTLPTPPTSSTPFIIYGWVNYSNGSACDNPAVNITNTNTSVEWQAETNASYNYYQLVLDTTNVSTGNVLSFNATDGTQFNVTNHTVTHDEINNGGIFDFNITIEIKEEPVNIRNYDNTSDLDSWAFSGVKGENVTVSWQNSSNGMPTCVIWNSGTDTITVCLYANNFTDGNGVQFNPNATEKIVVRDDGNTTPIDWSVVTNYLSNKNESSWYNFTLEAGGVKDVYLQLCIPMNVESGTYHSTFYAKKE